MAAITITAANVAYVSGPIRGDQVAGQAMTAGSVVYLAANGRWHLAQGDGTEIEAGSEDIGVALCNANSAGQRISVAVSGSIVDYGAGVLAAGLIYIIGDTAGSIYPLADAGSGDKVTVLGLAISTARLLIQRIYNAGAVVA